MRTSTVLGPVLATALFLIAADALAQGDAQGNAPPPSTATPTGGDAISPIEPAASTSVQAPPPVQPIPAEPIVRPDERTAYMIGKHRLKIGTLAIEYGITEQLSVGTEPPMWALRALVHVLVPNLHLKFQIFDRDPVAVAVQIAGYYADISRANFSGNLFAIPLTAYASVKVLPRITLHGEGAFIFARAVGTGDLTQASLNGATATRAAQVALLVQYQVNHFFSLTANGRYQVYTADLPLSGSSMPDAFTTASLSGQFVPPVKHPWEAFAGIAFLWQHFRASAGAGYGYYFVPGLDVANTSKTVVPDVSIAVVL
jgi:hypothetical protein